VSGKYKNLIIIITHDLSLFSFEIRFRLYVNPSFNYQVIRFSFRFRFTERELKQMIRFDSFAYFQKWDF